jgi:predicted nucleic acid-binding protein
VLILDTNVVSEVLRPEPNETVVAWFESQPRHQLFTTAITQAEIYYGINLLPKGSRRQKLLAVAQLIFEEDLENRVLPFSREAASHYAELATTRRSLGRPISQFDGMIAAVALLHGAHIATRNTADFDDCGILVVNPWSKQ